MHHGNDLNIAMICQKCRHIGRGQAEVMPPVQVVQMYPDSGRNIMGMGVQKRRKALQERQQNENEKAAVIPEHPGMLNRDQRFSKVTALNKEQLRAPLPAGSSIFPAFRLALSSP